MNNSKFINEILIGMRNEIPSNRILMIYRKEKDFENVFRLKVIKNNELGVDKID